MLTVRTIVDYKIIKDTPVPKIRRKTTREQRKFEGLCVPCGGSKPCNHCNGLAQLRRDRARGR